MKCPKCEQKERQYKNGKTKAGSQRYRCHNCGHSYTPSSHWSGKHHAVVMGINRISLLWTDEETHVPCDFCFYNPSQDGLTKNDHFQNMLKIAQERGFASKFNSSRLASRITSSIV